MIVVTWKNLLVWTIILFKHWRIVIVINQIYIQAQCISTPYNTIVHSFNSKLKLLHLLIVK